MKETIRGSQPPPPLHLLMVEDSAIDAELIESDLRLAGIEFEARRVDNEAAFRKQLIAFDPDLVLADYRLPTFDGRSALKIAQKHRDGLPVIFVSGAIGEECAVELMKQGATDYVLKDRLERLPLAVRRAMEEVAERTARQEAEKNLHLLNQQLEERVNQRTMELTEKSRQINEELQMARQLQMALLPQHFPTVPPGAPSEASAVRFLSFYQPSSTVSGDFFEVLQLSDTTVGVLVCDVMGHDVRAALVTGMLRALVEEFGDAANDPAVMLTHLNRSLVGILRQAQTTMFATAFYLVADLEKGELRFANAGHPSPLHVHGERGEVEIIQVEPCNGPALGLMRDSTYVTCTRRFDPRDLIILFTDGLIEVEDPSTHEPFCCQRLLEAARRRAKLPADQLFYGLLDDARHFGSANGFEDDVCLLGMEMTGSAVHPGEQRLPSDGARNYAVAT